MIKLTNKDVVVQCMATIEQCQEHVNALHGAGNFIRAHLSHETHADSVYHDLLMRIELDEHGKQRAGDVMRKRAGRAHHGRRMRRKLAEECAAQSGFAW